MSDVVQPMWHQLIQVSREMCIPPWELRDDAVDSIHMLCDAVQLEQSVEPSSSGSSGMYTHTLTTPLPTVVPQSSNLNIFIPQLWADAQLVAVYRSLSRRRPKRIRRRQVLVLARRRHWQERGLV